MKASFIAKFPEADIEFIALAGVDHEDTISKTLAQIAAGKQIDLQRVATEGIQLNFGATFPGGVHAPTATPDGEGGIIAMFNMNPAKPTFKMDDYLAGFFDGEGERTATDDDSFRHVRDWDQILTLPRRLSLRAPDELDIEPAGDIESLRYGRRCVGRTALAPNQEMVLGGIEGSAIELRLEVDPKLASVFEVNVLRSPKRGIHTNLLLQQERVQVPRTAPSQCLLSQGHVDRLVESGPLRERGHHRFFIFVGIVRCAFAASRVGACLHRAG